MFYQAEIWADCLAMFHVDINGLPGGEGVVLAQMILDHARQDEGGRVYSSVVRANRQRGQSAPATAGETALEVSDVQGNPELQGLDIEFEEG